MKTRIQKWGNSLALRIPKSFATEARLSEESVVDVSVVKGKLVVASVAKPKVTLEKLLAGINEENLHGEVFSGPAVGAEEW
jgi:antitoxin MazE